LKVVHIVRQFSPAVGGLESAVLSLARAQSETLGMDVRIVTLDRLFGKPAKLAATEIVAGLPVTRLPWRGSSRYPLAPGVLPALRDADIVHVHAIDFFFDFLALTWIFHRRAMIASTHGGFFHTTRFSALKTLWFNTLTRLSALAYGQVVACSQSDWTMFAQACARRLALVENGIDQDKFAGAAAARQTRTIICFGRLTAHKRVADLLPLLAALRVHHPDWRLIIAGGEGDQTFAALAETAACCGVADAVDFVRDPSDQELRAQCGQASFFASLSRYEGFGLAAVEAMSAGLLPLLSDIAPFRRLQELAPEIVILAPEAPEAVAALIESRLLPDAAYTAQRQRLQNAVQHYDWQQVARRYGGIYQARLQRRYPAPAAMGRRV